MRRYPRTRNGPADKELRARLAAAERENAELRGHLKLLLDGSGIVVAAWRRGEALEWVFIEALESAIAKAGAFVLTRGRG